MGNQAVKGAVLDSAVNVPVTAEELASQTAMIERNAKAKAAGLELLNAYQAVTTAEGVVIAAKGSAWQRLILASLAGITAAEMETQVPELPKIGAHRSAKSVQTKAHEFKIPLVDAGGKIRERNQVYAEAQALEAGIALKDKDGQPKDAKTLNSERAAAEKAEKETAKTPISSPLADCSDVELAAVFFARCAAANNEPEETARALTMRLANVQTMRVIVAQASREEKKAAQAAKAEAKKGEATAATRKAARAAAIVAQKAAIKENAAAVQADYKAAGLTVSKGEAAEIIADELDADELDGGALPEGAIAAARDEMRMTG